jgi:hypothetical protein
MVSHEDDRLARRNLDCAPRTTPDHMPSAKCTLEVTNGPIINRSLRGRLSWLEVDPVSLTSDVSILRRPKPTKSR